jgi:hypothetical protein
MLVGEFNVKDAALTPPNFTLVAPLKFIPVISTTVPVPPTFGVTEKGLGNGINVKPPRVPTPPGVVTEIVGPVLLGTTAWIVVGLSTVNDAAKKIPNLTAVVPVKFKPEMIIVAPVAADVGENEVMTGGGV